MTDSRSPSDVTDDLGDLGGWPQVRVRLGGLTAALITFSLLFLGYNGIHRPWYDAYQRIMTPPVASKEVVVVGIDAQSLAEVGAWPWSRYTMARLAEQISGRGAKAIGFDFLFSERDRQTPEDFVRLYPELSPAAVAEVRKQQSMDDIFAQVLGRNPVVLARFGVEDNSFDAPADVKAAGALFPPEAMFKGPQPSTIPTYPMAFSNLDILDGAAAGHGLANGPPDKDGIVRRVPLLGRPAGVLTPSLALDLVRVSEGGPEIKLIGDAKGLRAIRIGDHRVPVDPKGRLYLHYAGSPRKANGEPQAPYLTISAVDVLRRGLPENLFANKIVLVGLVAAGTSDVVNTPRDGRTYGVFVQAQAVNSILRSAGLQRPVWAVLAEWWTCLALVLVAWFGVPRAPLSVVIAVAAGELLTAFGVSYFAFQHDVLLSPIPMILPGAAASLTMVTMMFVEGRRVQTRLRSELEGERLSAAKVTGELAAASEIQAGMLIPRASLASINPRVEVDAVLQPARTVGGDLYDAFMADHYRLCFLVGDVTGKGVPASLFMALSKALSRSLLARLDLTLAQGIAGINTELSRDNTQAMAVSLLVGVLNLDDGSLDLVCAGHENPLLVHVDGSVEELRLDGGPPLCVDETFIYPIEKFRLRPGETLVVLTDGVTEAQSLSLDLFGRDRAMAAVVKPGPLPGMVDGLVASVREFEGGGEPSDDLTVMAIRFSGR